MAVRISCTPPGAEERDGKKRREVESRDRWAVDEPPGDYEGTAALEPYVEIWIQKGPDPEELDRVDNVMRRGSVSIRMTAGQASEASFTLQDNAREMLQPDLRRPGEMTLFDEAARRELSLQTRRPGLSLGGGRAPVEEFEARRRAANAAFRSLTPLLYGRRVEIWGGYAWPRSARRLLFTGVIHRANPQFLPNGEVHVNIRAVGSPFFKLTRYVFREDRFPSQFPRMPRRRQVQASEAAAPKSIKDVLPLAAPYEDAILTAARKYGVPDSLIAAVIWQESNWDPAAVGAHGERGLMQLMLETARGLGYTGTEEGLADPSTNIDLGTRYLASLYADPRLERKWENVLSAFNGGIRPELGFGLPARLPVQCGGRTVPIGQYCNQGYVDSVLARWDKITSERVGATVRELQRREQERKEAEKSLQLEADMRAQGIDTTILFTPWAEIPEGATMSLGELVQNLVTQYGLCAEVSERFYTAPEYQLYWDPRVAGDGDQEPKPRVHVRRSTDWAFLAHLARVYGAVLRQQGDTVSFLAEEEAQTDLDEEVSFVWHTPYPLAGTRTFVRPEEFDPRRPGPYPILRVLQADIDLLLIGASAEHGLFYTRDGQLVRYLEPAQPAPGRTFRYQEIEVDRERIHQLRTREVVELAGRALKAPFTGRRDPEILSYLLISEKQANVQDTRDRTRPLYVNPGWSLTLEVMGTVFVEVGRSYRVHNLAPFLEGWWLCREVQHTLGDRFVTRVTLGWIGRTPREHAEWPGRP